MKIAAIIIGALVALGLVGLVVWLLTRPDPATSSAPAPTVGVQGSAPQPTSTTRKRRRGGFLSDVGSFLQSVAPVAGTIVGGAVGGPAGAAAGGAIGGAVAAA